MHDDVLNDPAGADNRQYDEMEYANLVAITGTIILVPNHLLKLQWPIWKSSGQWRLMAK